MPWQRLRILIVEDQQPFADMLAKVIDPILQRFPGSQIIFQAELDPALEIIRATPAPDMVLLDLSLGLKSIEQTLEYVEEIHSRSPLLIVTGHSPDRVRKILAGRALQVEVVQKTPEIWKDNLIVRLIIKAIEYWQRDRFSRIDANLERMKTIVQNGHARTTTSPTTT